MNDTRTKLTVQRVPSIAPWYLYLLPYTQALPLAVPHQSALATTVLNWLPAIRSLYPQHHLAGFLQYNQLNLGGTANLMAERVHDWGVDWLLGYWPEREPPTLWTVKDFSSLDIGEMPRPMMNQIFGITKGDAAILDATRCMLGNGPMILTLSSLTHDQVKSQAKGQFQPLIRELSLKNFPGYYPLLCAATFAEANRDKIDAWVCGIDFFLRESPEENGIFVASRHDLEPALQQSGAITDQPGHWHWDLQQGGL